MDEILTFIKCAYPKFTEEQARVYRVCLADIPVEILKKAVVNVIKRSPYMPTVAALVEESKTIWKYASGEQIPNAEMAWSEVYKAIGAVGPYRTPEFADKITTKTVECMGWQSLCMAQDSEISVLRGQFMRMYTSILASRETAVRMKISLSDGVIKNLVQATRKQLAEKKAKALEGGKHGIQE